MTTAFSLTEGLNLINRVAIVTGASSGIGQEITRVLVLRNCRVIMAVRNPTKAQGVVNEFIAANPNDAEGIKSRCDIRLCDTSSMESVREFTKTIDKDRLTIDYTFLNAGVFGVPFLKTSEGFERTLATNYIGHYLMVRLLLQYGLIAKNGRIISVMSEGYRTPMATVDLETLANPKPTWLSMFLSPKSKVLLLMAQLEFTRRVKGTKFSSITWNSAEPGATITNNVNQFGGFAKPLLSLLAHSVEIGTAPLVWLAVRPEEAISGKHYGYNRTEHELPAKVLDEDLQKQVWDTTEKILGLGSFNPNENL